MVIYGDLWWHFVVIVGVWRSFGSIDCGERRVSARSRPRCDPTEILMCSMEQPIPEDEEDGGWKQDMKKHSWYIAISSTI